MSPELDAIVMKGLSREPAERWQTAREMALALEKLGPASPSEVGAWVERLAGPELAERAAMLAAVETVKLSTPGSSGELMEEVAASEMVLEEGVAADPPPARGSFASLGRPLDPSTLSSLSQDVDDSQALDASRRRSFLGAVVMGVLFAGVALILLATMRPPADAPAANAANSVTSCCGS